MRQGKPLPSAGLIMGGDKTVKPHEIKCAVVSRMFRDTIIVGKRVADVETVAEQAVPPSEKAAAEREIREYMIRDDDCPVVMVSSGVIALRPDESRIEQYLKRYCDDDSQMPPEFREGL